MVFKRRAARSTRQRIGDFLWPRGGWRRAASYLLHRVRRLPDPPHRIGRGVAAGIFVSFTPFFGFHFLLAALVAWAIRGNILASVLATFLGNPLTFPFIASVSIEIGSWMLGLPGGVALPRIVGAFGQAMLELWRNLAAIFTPAEMHWERFNDLFMNLFLPYLIGGILPGLVCAVIGHMVTHRLVTAYQNRRLKKLRQRARARHGTAGPAAKAEEEA